MDVDLKCRIIRNGDYHRVLLPLLLEEKSLEPYIVILHDFISINEADLLIEKAKPKVRV